ncbi:MAG: hypothetical protein ACLFP8_05855 [Alphaproteobacteria bacterium]
MLSYDNLNVEIQSSQRTCAMENWENDISGVVLEVCGKEEDPSGFRVIYLKGGMPGNNNTLDSESYCVGGSYLKHRLDRLRRAGFEAPMTKRAINLLNRERMGRYG